MERGPTEDRRERKPLIDEASLDRKTALAPLVSPAALATTLSRQDADPWIAFPHHRLLSRELVALHARLPGSRRHLMVMMPPRHGKSELCSHWFPVWNFALDPTTKIIMCSHSQELAKKFSRAVRKTIREHYPMIGTRMLEDSRAAHRWETSEGGEMFAAGIGGGISGRGADVLILDDPVKDAEAANSQQIRQNTWDWWETTFLSRRAPNAIVLLIMCMTGDTPVLMADGTETPLREIRPGDRVATYENGEITAATVKNWANQGPDSVLEIRTRYGSIVRANARHPFLVARDGGVEWRRTGTLRKGDEILRVTGASGAALCARPDAASRLGVGASAGPTITRTAGRMGLAPRLSTLGVVARRAFDIVTASVSRSTSAFWPSRVASALYAAFRLPVATRAPIGLENSASITTSVGSVAFSATTAISPSATGKPRGSSKPPQPTFVVARDPIVSITAAGVEDVFDIQVDCTENFIANGLVSHNTRWHEDDLAGRLLQREPDLWQVLKLPALALEDDPLGRQVGEALWPCDKNGETKQDFDEEGLALTKRRGPQAFRALYQQDPVGLEGLGIQRSWWRRYDEPPEKIAELCDTVLMSWDTTFKDTDSSDYVGGLVLGRLGHKVFLLDGIREHLNAPNTMREIRKMRAKWPMAKRVLIEESANGPAIIQMLEQELTGIVPVRARGSKTVRLHWGVSSVAGFIEDGNVYLPRAHSKHSETGRCHVEVAEELISEGAAFPHGAHDDLVDACVQGVSFLIPQGWANLRKWGKEIAEEVEANVGFIQQHNIGLRQAIRKKVELQLKNKEVGSDMPGWN